MCDHCFSTQPPPPKRGTSQISETYIVGLRMVYQVWQHKLLRNPHLNVSLLGGGIVEKQGFNIGETYIFRLEESLWLQLMFFNQHKKFIVFSLSKICISWSTWPLYFLTHFLISHYSTHRQGESSWKKPLNEFGYIEENVGNCITIIAASKNW